MAAISMLLTGYEVRRARGQDTTIYHTQDMGWKHFTFLGGGRPDSEGVGEFYFLREEDQGDMKKFFPWRTRESGMGPVRGYTVTYSHKFGMQLWLFVELRLPEGRRNVPCLIAQADLTDLRTKADFQRYWGHAIQWLESTFPFGLHGFVEYDSSVNRHRFVDAPEYDFNVAAATPIPAAVIALAASEPEVGAEGGEQLPESPAG